MINQAASISLIATVKNEADNIVALLDSMLAQTRLPDEIVINDNGSSDTTVALIERYIADGHPIRLVHGGFNIPSGRNNAIRHAHGPLIASCDAGLTLPPDWLATIVAPLQQGTADVVGGFYQPAPRSVWELALGATNYPDVHEIDPATFLPAGQSVAFTKAAWASVGGYPEWADTCEDLLFDLALRQRGARFAFAPTAAVQFRPRESARAYFKQYFTYARGDGVGRLFGRRHLIRYGSYIALVTLLTSAHRRRWPLGWLVPVLLPGVMYHIYKPYQRLWRRAPDRSWPQRLLAFALVPLQRLIGDVAKMLGYPVGVWRRCLLRRAPQTTFDSSAPGAVTVGKER